ncbi:hypothetical protein DQ806_05425 [Salmonella enterica subsp. enterica serovar Okatie]|nr:hypothetical protein [Salmonella enterica subsp. enterica serovar Okatie]
MNIYVDYRSLTHIKRQLNIIKVNNQERILFIELNSRLNILHQLQTDHAPLPGHGLFLLYVLIRNYQ